MRRSKTNLCAIINIIVEYRNQQGWENNDKPINLAKSMAIEAAELLENYQWDEEPISTLNVKEELADVLMYGLAMTHDLKINLQEILEERICNLERKMEK